LQTATTRLLVVGWDGAEPALVEEMLEAGELPNLSRLARIGTYGRVLSTVPASSLPAWTSALTGLRPARHGVVDFLRRDRRSYRLRLYGARDRAGPTVLALATRAGLRVASLGIPGTQPAERDVLTIPGFDTPISASGLRSCSPRWFADWLRGRHLNWPRVEDEIWQGPGWHRRVARQLPINIEKKTKIVEEILQAHPVDLAWVVFNEFDTAAHHFWAFRDHSSPRTRGIRRGNHGDRPGVGDVPRQVLRSLDQGLGRLLRLVDQRHARVVVVSDHGFGSNHDRVVYINRFLEQTGWLRFSKGAGRATRALASMAEGAARLVPARKRSWMMENIPERVALELESARRLGGIDWKNSAAFSDELPQYPGIWLNLAGRERQGTVLPETAARLLRKLLEQLLDLRDERGRAVVARAWLRQDLGPGAYLDRFPDLLLELARPGGHRLLADVSDGPGPWIRRLEDAECIGSKGIGTSGSHLAEGILLAAGAGVKAGALAGARLWDLAPSMLAMLDLEVPAGLDGRVLPELAPTARHGGMLLSSDLAGRQRHGGLLRALRNLGYL